MRSATCTISFRAALGDADELAGLALDDELVELPDVLHAEDLVPVPRLAVGLEELGPLLEGAPAGAGRAAGNAG